MSKPLKLEKFYGRRLDHVTNKYFIEEETGWQPCHPNYTNEWGTRCYVHVNQYHQKLNHLKVCNRAENRGSRLSFTPNRTCMLDPIWHNPIQDGPVPKIKDLIKATTQTQRDFYFKRAINMKDRRYKWDGTLKTEETEDEEDEEDVDAFKAIPKQIRGPHRFQEAENAKAAYITQVSQKLKIKPTTYTERELRIMKACYSMHLELVEKEKEKPPPQPPSPITPQPSTPHATLPAPRPPSIPATPSTASFHHSDEEDDDDQSNYQDIDNLFWAQR